MTGFNNLEEHQTFGHWSSPEYAAILQFGENQTCGTCKGYGTVESEHGVGICVDCGMAIPLEDAKEIIRQYDEVESFVISHYEFCENGDNSTDLAKYWHCCKRIVEQQNNLPY